MKELRDPQLDERAVTATLSNGQKVRLFCHQLWLHRYQVHLDGPGI